VGSTPAPVNPDSRTDVSAGGANVVLLTRFNLPSVGVESFVRAEENWLINRWALFERYCLPSVAAQDDPDVTWIIYLDPLTPAWLLDAMAPHSRSGLVTAVLRESVSPAELVADITAALGRTEPHLITANLDNDDALAKDFVRRLRATVPGVGPTAIYFERGLIRTPAGVFSHRDPSNAFCAVREPADAPVTCWKDWHNRLERHMPVMVVGGSPAWLQVVHGQNVSNRVHGVLVSPAPYRPLFPGALDDVGTPTRRRMLSDRLLASPARVVRDAVRTTLRRIATRVLGKEGWDRAKHVLRSVRQRR
jgi:hypothetical protein